MPKGDLSFARLSIFIKPNRYSENCRHRRCANDPTPYINITLIMAFTSDSLGFSCVWRPPQARQLHTPHRGTDDKIPFLTCQHIPILGQETRSRKGRAALSKGKTGGFCGQGLCEASAEPWGTFRFGLRRSLVFVPGLAIG